MQPRSDAERVLYIATEVVALAMTAWLVWMYLPESFKLELRRGIRAVRVPFTAASAERKARTEMTMDVIDLAYTFGRVPEQWVAEVG